MTEFHLKAGLFVFAVAASLLALWLGGMLVGMLIIIAFILAFAGVAALPGLADAISKISKAGPQ